jgi:lipopolysaccharide export system permease protein
VTQVVFVRILDRYVVRETALGMFTWVGAVTIVMLVQTLFELMDFFVNQKVPFLITLEILLLYIPAQMVMTFPISGLLAAELNMGRLCRDSELVAIEASGVSIRRFLLPYLGFSLLVAFGSFLLNDFIVPETNHRAQTLIRYYVYKKAPPKIQQNVFFRDAENRYFYVNELDATTWEMRNVIIYELGKGRKFPDVIREREGPLGGGPMDSGEGGAPPLRGRWVPGGRGGICGHAHRYEGGAPGVL